MWPPDLYQILTRLIRAMCWIFFSSNACPHVGKGQSPSLSLTFNFLPTSPNLVGVLTRPQGTRPPSLAPAQSTVRAGRVAPKRCSSRRPHLRGVFTRHPQPRPPKDAPAQSKTAEGRVVVGCQATVPRGTPTIGGRIDTPQWNTPTESCPRTINGLGGACSSETAIVTTPTL